MNFKFYDFLVTYFASICWTCN